MPKFPELQRLLAPPKYQAAIRLFGREAKLRVLEIGIANQAARVAKDWLPHCHFSGADIAEPARDPGDHAALDQFYLVGTDGVSGYQQIPDESFDLVILNHVLEHVLEPSNLVKTAAAKLRPGGLFYGAFPSLKSLSLPSGTGTLHFCDDPTHVSVVDIIAVVNILLRADMRILFAGRTRDPIRWLIGALILPLAFARRLLTGRWHARGLWYVMGFEDSVVGRKHQP